MMFPAQASSSPWGPASRVCFIPTPNSLGGLGLGLPPESCQVGSIARLPSQLLSEPASALSARLAPGLQLASLGLPSTVDFHRQFRKVAGLLEGKNEDPVSYPGDHPPTGWAGQGPFCTALGTSPPTPRPVPQLPLLRLQREAWRVPAKP